MHKFYSWSMPFMLLSHVIFSQNFQPLLVPINSPSSPESNPCFTGNGRTLVYEAPIGDYDRQLVAISYQRAGIWSKPEPVPGISQKAEKVFNGGHFISFEGNFIFFSSGRYGGIGGNDIYYVEKKGNSWTPAKNVGKPINSIGSENDPALSPDGRQLYFVRYNDKKTATGKPCGKIFVSERKGKDSYSEPKELIAPINSGCECNPRILADNSMTFASERQGGKGGYDQYKSTFNENGSWSVPVPLTFINTTGDDLYISIPAGGDFLYMTGKSKVATDIVKIIIPENLQAKNVLALTGNVADAQTKIPLNAKILVHKLKLNTQNYTGTVDGNYALFLPEKEVYTITTSSKGYSFHTQTYNLDTLSRFRELRNEIRLISLKNYNRFTITDIEFENDTSSLTKHSELILDNLVKMLQENPTVSIDIESHMDKVITDSLPQPGLTEIISDTNVTSEDQQVHIKTLYHNDRTKKEAEAVKNYLLKKRIAASRITFQGMSDQKPCNLPLGLTVKCTNKRLEIKITKE